MYNLGQCATVTLLLVINILDKKYAGPILGCVSGMLTVHFFATFSYTISFSDASISLKFNLCLTNFLATAVSHLCMLVQRNIPFIFDQSRNKFMSRSHAQFWHNQSDRLLLFYQIIALSLPYSFSFVPSSQNSLIFFFCISHLSPIFYFCFNLSFPVFSISDIETLNWRVNKIQRDRQTTERIKNMWSAIYRENREVYLFFLGKLEQALPRFPLFYILFCNKFVRLF